MQPAIQLSVDEGQRCDPLAAEVAALNKLITELSKRVEEVVAKTNAPLLLAVSSYGTWPSDTIIGIVDTNITWNGSGTTGLST